MSPWASRQYKFDEDRKSIGYRLATLQKIVIFVAIFDKVMFLRAQRFLGTSFKVIPDICLSRGVVNPSSDPHHVACCSVTRLGQQCVILCFIYFESTFESRDLLWDCTFLQPQQLDRASRKNFPSTLEASLETDSPEKKNAIAQTVHWPLCLPICIASCFSAGGSDSGCSTQSFLILFIRL